MSHSFSKNKFMKPSDEYGSDSYRSSSHSIRHSQQGWRKRKSEEPPSGDSQSSNEKQAEKDILTDEEMNSLAAKIVKAEIMGKTQLVQELKTKLENARKARETTKDEDNVIILTRTNDRGFTQPVRHNTSKNEEKKRKKYETHVDGERVRYFEDDGKYSLNEMFEREQMTTAADFNAEFVGLATKSKGDEDHAIDDLFMEQSTSNKNKKDDSTQRTVEKQKNKERTLESCTWCLMNNKIQKHFIISTGSKVFLSIPHFQSLTKNHCLIVPTYHVTCSTLLDEDVWDEIMDYCQKLVNTFRKKNLDVIFFESAMNFKHYPHMVIQCVPLPYDSSNLAPIYFKKAIMECEKEWAQNKKLVNIKKMNVRRAVPKGLPYFMVNFGLDDGFAHVIEDEKYFPKNFAQEIIGGMLDLDHQVWRKLRADDFETQCKKVNEFQKIWKS